MAEAFSMEVSSASGSRMDYSAMGPPPLLPLRILAGKQAGSRKRSLPSELDHHNSYAYHCDTMYSCDISSLSQSCFCYEEDIETPTSSYESAIIGEAHGLISDMLADTSLPPHVISGLRAVSNLLKPPENHGPSHKPKISPLVSLTEATNYGSDSEDLPYTGERPSSLPKRLRRSLPPSLIRRMSTSTWTTTTSATGMPTLEPEPCRTRSSSFRHSRESTPGSSPTGSRSNSPSPSSPTTISLTIPKSRSFSVASVGAHSGSTTQKRPNRERKSFFLQNSPVAPSGSESVASSTPSPIKTDKCLSPLVKGEVEIKELSSKSLVSPATKDIQSGVLSKRLNITSDYESSDSPSSSDHSDNVTSVDDLALRSSKPTKPEITSSTIYHHDSIIKKKKVPTATLR